LRGRCEHCTHRLRRTADISGSKALPRSNHLPVRCKAVR
jgi:hypothetical protein